MNMPPVSWPPVAARPLIQVKARPALPCNLFLWVPRIVGHHATKQERTVRMFRRILVPIDGSSLSRVGLERAIALAKNQKARLRVMHVVDEQGLIQGMEPTMNISELLDGLVTEGRKILAAAAVTAKKYGVKADTVLHEVLIGRVADRIVREAAKWHADVIVMGTHGRRGIGRLVMGSDAENVLRQSPVPVLLVRGAKRRRR